jgi:hypothetical protein
VTRATAAAKNFLISQILRQAENDQISLSDLETRMLHFSETERTPPDWADLNTEFEEQYDSEDYESKIASLIHNRLFTLRSTESPDLEKWNQSVTALSAEDHYILVMIRKAQASQLGRTSDKRPPFDRLKLALTAAAIITLVFLVIFAINSLKH